MKWKNPPAESREFSRPHIRRETGPEDEVEWCYNSFVTYNIAYTHRLTSQYSFPRILIS